jgi:hypothetical protein
MCIIVDANATAQLCQPSLTQDAQAVVDWIEKNDGRVVHGGKLTNELFANNRVARWLRVLSQAGRATQVPADSVTAEVRQIQELALCSSNDFHIIALARLSGARLLFSHDQALHTDFTNPALINKPRGKVCQNATHRHLLAKSVCKV